MIRLLLLVVIVVIVVEEEEEEEEEEEVEVLTTDLHQLPRSRNTELYLQSPICLHGIVLNLLSIGTT
jgi:hypothetical protein